MSKHRTVVVLFTRDLRLHDQPALAAAVDRAEQVVPLFVLDDAVLAAFGAPNRVAFLVEALRDLDSSLRLRGGALVVRRGSVVGETVRLALDVDATAVFVSEDVSAYAQERERRLRTGLAAAGAALEAYPGVTVSTMSASSATWCAEWLCRVPMKCQTIPSTRSRLVRSSLT